VKRPAIVPLVVLGTALALAVFAIVRLTSRAPEEPAPEPSVAAPVEGAPATEPDAEAMRRLNVLVYFPSAESDGLIGEPHEIFMTSAPGDRAKQILADLISGPESGRAMHAIPPGTRLRQVYVLENGTAYVDFSADLKQGLGGGSAEELFTIYSIINSVALNIPEIRRVGILINGEPVETLNGHLDLRRPLGPDVSIIAMETQPMTVHAPADEPLLG
jgi:spore germination protein GerM